MEYGCGLTTAYVDQIKEGENKSKFGVFLKSKPYQYSKRKDLIPTDTKEEMQCKLDKYAKDHKLKAK